MTQTPQPPDSLGNRVTNLERGMSDLRIAAEALLQTAQIHQQNFETVTAELQKTRTELQVFRQRQLESDQRFEVMLAELRQIKIDGDARFNGFQTEIQRILNRLFNQQDDSLSKE